MSDERRLESWFDVGGEPEKDLDSLVAAASQEFLRSQKAGTGADDPTLAERFRHSAIPENGVGIQKYFGLLKQVIENSVPVSSPAFIGHMTSALPYFVRPISRLLTSLNQNLVKVETASTLTPFEREALAMMHRLVFGCGDDFYAQHIQENASTLGIVTSGGTLANISGLWIARNRALRTERGPIDRVGMHGGSGNAGRPVIIGSTLMHYSLEKAVDLLGIGTDGFIRVPVDEENRVRIPELKATVEACRSRGDRIVSLIGIAGTTDAGSIDPLEAIADVAAEARCHFHVDAAWGGPLLFSEKYRTRLRGIERADSVTIDGHKQLYLPMGLGLVLLRDPHAAKVIEKQAQYIIREGSPDLGRRALEGSRPGMALYLHAGLSLLGRNGYGQLVEAGVEKAVALSRMLDEREEFELLSTPQMNIVNYRFVPPELRAKAKAKSLAADEQESINRVNVRLQEHLRRKGESFVSRTTLRFTRHGSDIPVVALRAVLANPLTLDLHLRSALDEQIAAVHGLEASTQ